MQTSLILCRRLTRIKQEMTARKLSASNSSFSAMILVFQKISFGGSCLRKSELICAKLCSQYSFLFSIYECAGCKSIFDNISTLKEHYQACQTQNSLPGTFDPLNPHCARLIFNNSLHPSSRIACDKCPKLSFCSFVGLRLHYARDHSIFVNDDHTQISNKGKPRHSCVVC